MARVHRQVPYCGQVKFGTKGPHVIAYKRTLSRCGLLAWPKPGHHFTPVCGKNMQIAIAKFGARHDIKNYGVIGERTHHFLEYAVRTGHPKESAWDDVAVAVMRTYYKRLHEDPIAKIRKEIVDAWAYWTEHKSITYYIQRRPMRLIEPPQLISGADCSEFFTIGHWAGGAVDPNGRGYDGEGYTGTLMGHGTKCRLDELDAGDAIMYGYTTSPSDAFPYGSPTHVAGYDGDAGVYSMGHQGDPTHRPIEYGIVVNCYVKFDVKAR